MNCEQARDLLLDLAYSELEAACRPAVEAHVEACPACRQELARLRSARTALARFRGDEPAAPDVETAMSSRVLRDPVAQRPRRRRLVPALAAAAAVVLLAVTLWLFQEKTTSPVLAANGPVEIKRMNVSLTIMSAPEWAGNWTPPGQQAAQMESRGGYRPYYQWQGLALVRDQRMIRNLNKGATEVTFTDVPSGIQPDTVRLRSLDVPGGLAILEQNYQYDLASAAAVLRKYVDKDIIVTYKDDGIASGRLLSFDDATLVMQQEPLTQERPLPSTPVNIARKEIRAIRFAKLPEGLLSRPTLLWKLQNAAALQQQFEVAYMTSGLFWRADYVLRIRPAQAPARGAGDKAAAGETARSQAAIPDIIDSAEMVGYATIANTSGVTYQDAQLKLMAGDLNILRPPHVVYVYDRSGALAESAEKGEQFQEKSFFEYHLYTLGEPTTLRDNETKQIQLVSGEGLRLRRAYVYDPAENPTAARVVSEMKNSRENGLGKPLPKGVIRLYAPDPDGQETYVAQTTIDHTPADEKLRLPWGYAFDIACEAKQTENEVRGPEVSAAWQYSLRNHKDADVNVTILVRVPITTYKAEAGNGQPWHVREVGIVEIPVAVRAGGEAVVNFSCSCNNVSGGGLKSPYDEAIKERKD